jgi:hypothetical protein
LILWLQMRGQEKSRPLLTSWKESNILGKNKPCLPPALTLVSYSLYYSTLEKCRLTFSGIHGVIPQMTELFTTTAVRTSNPTKFNLSQRCWIL